MTARIESAAASLHLAFGTRFEDLYDTGGLARLDGDSWPPWRAADPDLKARLVAARAAPDSLATKEEAELLLAVSPILDELHRGALRDRGRSRPWWPRIPRRSRSSA